MAFSITLTGPIFSIDLALNNRSHAVVTTEALVSRAIDGRIPLQSLYPWMESVDRLEANAGSEGITWTAPALTAEIWNSAALVIDPSGSLELRVGDKSVASPDRIRVTGTRRELEEIRIWSTPGYFDLKTEIIAALAYRGAPVVWNEVSDPAYLLSDPPSEGHPHVLLTSDIEVLRLDSLIGSYRPVDETKTTWWSSGVSGTFSASLAMDAYSPEAALIFLLQGNPDLFDPEGRLPTATAPLLTAAAAGRAADRNRAAVSGTAATTEPVTVTAGSPVPAGPPVPAGSPQFPFTDLFVTEEPLTALASGRAGWAVSLPSSNETIPEATRLESGGQRAAVSAPGAPATVSGAPPAAGADPGVSGAALMLTGAPTGMADFVRVGYAAVPAGADPVLGALLLDDLARFVPPPGGQQNVKIPMDSRMVRFFDVYSRTGRLAISGQMSAELAIEVMNRYIADQ